MAKKKKQSLTERIGALISRVGEKPEPTFGYIKGELVDCRSLAQSLEDGAAIRETEAKLEAAQTALEQANTQNAKIESELKTANAEINQFRAERKKRKEERKRQEEMPDIQFKILKLLPSQHGGNWLGFNEISCAVGIPVDEAEIHLNRLEEAKPKLVERRYNAYDAVVWHRTIAGTELVLAHRLAGQEQAPQRKFPDLPTIEEDVLVMMIGQSEETVEAEICYRLHRPLEIVKSILSALKDKGFVTYDAEQPTYGLSGRFWFITNLGREYLVERDKL
jgi:hypothetical protein